MANCSIPSSSPASGRISTKSSRPSRKPNSASTSFFAALSLTKNTRRARLSFFNVQRPTPKAFASKALNARRSIHGVESCALDVRRWGVSSIRRVKGAWWPSRSSKPLSSRLTGRGRFDSYPLRRRIFELRLSIFDCSVATAPRAVRRFPEGR